MLGEALRWQLLGDDPERARKLVDMLWERMGFEPIPPERHKYSLLHAAPDGKAPEPPAPAKMIPYSVEAGLPVDGPYPDVARRHAPELVGSKCPVVDARGALSQATAAELKRFMDVRNPMPCIIKNLPLFRRAVERWDIGYLADHMGEQVYHTFASSQEERRFAYFFDERNEGAYEAPPIAEARRMTFQDFVQRSKNSKDGKAYYLQTPVLRYEGDQTTCPKFDRELEGDLHTMDNAMMRQLSALGSFGPISRNQLFVSFSDFLTAVHYDQQHNIYLQIRGAKRFLLFDATLLPALYPYPSHHPLDRKGRIDLENLDFERFPRSRALAGQGVEALLEPGDILFMPMSWFHHVHSVGPENVSLNWWFCDSGVLFEPGSVKWPLAPASIVEFSRHIEYFAAEQLGPTNVASFVEWWLGDQPAPVDTILLDRWRLMRNYILRRLSLLPRSVARAVLAGLDPRRFRGLRRREGEVKAIEGLQDKHGVSSLLEGLEELRVGLFRCSMTGQTYRTLGHAVDAIPKEKLRVFLECCEELLELLRDRTDWKATDGQAPEPLSGEFLFGREEARRAPAAILRSLQDLSALASAQRVKVATVDNGFFANWLQVLDARLFADEAVAVEPDWVLTGKEKEFNYGQAGDDIFRALFDEPVAVASPPERSGKGEQEEPYIVRNRQNMLLVNVFRGRFLQGPRAARRRQLYADAAARMFRPSAAALQARDAALASVSRPPGAPLIGVHKRVDNPGTARMQLEQVMLHTEAFVQAARLLAARRAGSAAAAADAVVVLATDDEGAVTAFREAFGSRLVVCSEAKRSCGGIDERHMPVEVHGQASRLSVDDARDCLVDALLLASCDAFVHADSNVTIAAGIMNPRSEAVHIRDLLPDAKAASPWPGYRRCRLPL